MIRKYDKNGSHKLERDQLVALLTDLDISTPKGTKPSDDEVAWVLKVGDKAKDGGIDAKELEDVLACWATYVNKRDEWDAKIQEFDKSKTGNLTKDEVAAYLQSLNGDKPVSPEELEMVMKEADAMGDGSINTMELAMATSLWYGYVERKGCCT